MAVIKYKDANGNWQTVVGVVIQNEVVQETGNSETAVMSQKAVSEKLDGKLSTSGGTMSGPITMSDSTKHSFNFKAGEFIDGFGNIVFKDGVEHSWNVAQNDISSISFSIFSNSNQNVDQQCIIHSVYDRGLTINTIKSNPNWSLISFNIGGQEQTYFGYRADLALLYSPKSFKSEENFYGLSFVSTSDIRKKDIIENINLDVEDIANAPVFKFTWLNPEMPEGVSVGTSAQYWKTILPELVTEGKDDEKTLSMQYGVAGLVSSVALAKKVVEQEETIKSQEARIKALEDAIAEIQNKLK